MTTGQVYTGTAEVETHDIDIAEDGTRCTVVARPGPVVSKIKNRVDMRTSRPDTALVLVPLTGTFGMLC